MNTLSYKGYTLPVDHPDVKKLKEFFTVNINTVAYAPVAKDDTTFVVFKENDNKLYIPRHYGLQTYGLPRVNKIRAGDDMHTNVEFNGHLRDNQMEPVKVFLQKARDPLHMGGILQLPPGWGKTVMALYISYVLRKKTIVIVHKDFLLKQWKERIEQYLPNARVGKIKQSTHITDDCDIVIASLQTLCARQFKDTSFGFVIVDECHHMGAQVFSQALHKLNFMYSLGLSATVSRTDGLTKVFKWFLGDVVFKAQRKTSEQQHLIVTLKQFEDTNHAYSFEHQLYNGKPNIAKMINNICAYAPRTNMICDEIVKILQTDRQRNVLVLSDRRKHLADINDGLQQRNVDAEDIAFYVGGMSNADLLHSETKQILLGTYNMVSEGFDLPKLDTLIMASPKSQVEQSVGRIQRKSAQDALFSPLVLDIVDTFSIFRNQAVKRCKFYHKSHFSVRGDIPQRTGVVDTFKLSMTPMFI
jgi:superfamily II DNA or RNA helicase